MTRTNLLGIYVGREIEKRDDNYSAITALPEYAVKLFSRSYKCVSQEMRIGRRQIKHGSFVRTRASNKQIPRSPGYHCTMRDACRCIRACRSC